MAIFTMGNGRMGREMEMEVASSSKVDTIRETG